jgi:hypothetical protein
VVHRSPATNSPAPLWRHSARVAIVESGECARTSVMSGADIPLTRRFDRFGIDGVPGRHVWHQPRTACSCSMSPSSSWEQCWSSSPVWKPSSACPGRGSIDVGLRANLWLPCRATGSPCAWPRRLCSTLHCLSFRDMALLRHLIGPVGRWGMGRKEATIPNRIRHCACGCTFVFRRHYRTRQFQAVEMAPHDRGTVAIMPDGTFRPLGPFESYIGPRFRVHAVVCAQVRAIRPQLESTV